MKPIRSKKLQGRSFCVRSIGIAAAERLRRSSLWRIVGRYGTCIYCTDSAGSLICIGGHALGGGPLYVVCSTAPSFCWQALAATHVSVNPDNTLVLEEDEIVLDLSPAVPWDITLRDIDTRCSSLTDDISWLAKQAGVQAPPQSLGALIPALLQDSPPPECAFDALNPVQRHVLKRLGQAGNHLDFDRPGWDKDLAERLDALIGLGPGLTPSGDDLLAGTVLGLGKLRQPETAIRCAGRFATVAETGTTPVSCAFFKELAAGRLSELQAALLEAFGTGSPARREALVHRLQQWGATSGWDLLTGFFFIVRLFDGSPPDQPTRRLRKEVSVCS